MAGGWIDISTPLRAGMPVWPGDPPVRVERVAAIGRGDVYNLSAMSMCLHTGTHVDAPVHYIEGGAGMESMPLDATTGPARVIEIAGSQAIRVEELRRHSVRRGERILFRAGPGYVTREAAVHLARRGVRAVGIDALSIGAPDEEGDEVHRILLLAGVWVIEGLDLAQVAPGRYDLVCLPLSIPGADGAPARAMLRRR